MKKIKYFVLLVLLAVVLASCTPTTNPGQEDTTPEYNEEGDPYPNRNPNGDKYEKGHLAYNLLNGEDGAYYEVTGIGDIKSKDVVIPDVYRGYPVKVIADSAFLECETMETISIPTSVTTIGWFAFYKCINLKVVHIPNSVEVICSYAFYYCTSLENVTLPDDLLSFGTRCFYNCQSLTSLIIPLSVHWVGESAVGKCHKIIVYCEAPSKPSYWHRSWNRDRRPVEWGYTEK